MKLIDDFGKTWHRLWSMRIMLFTALLGAAEQAFILAGAAPEGFVPKWAYLVLMGLTAVARAVKQPPREDCQP